MPIYIDEVVISVEVTNEGATGPTAAPPAAEDKQIIIDECVERVLEILAGRQER